jgi:molybdenum cofactor synthesis domain-containing protein
MSGTPAHDDGLDVALVICSDRAALGARADATRSLLEPLLRAAGHRLAATRVVADDRAAIAAALRELAAAHALVLTSGGTGLAARDVTPEATRDVISREVPGLAEAMRARSLASTPMAMLSRATAGTLGGALIVNLPGSPRGAAECLEVALPAAVHAARLLSGMVKDCQAELGSRARAATAHDEGRGA